MRNLRNISHGVFRAYTTPSPLSSFSALCWDVSRDELIVACGPTAEDQRIELLRIGRNVRGTSPALLHSRPIASWDYPTQSPNGEPDSICDMHFFPDTLTTVLILSSGDIISVVEDDDSATGLAFSSPPHAEGTAHVEIVGTLTPSISAARWSPDEELLVLVTGDGKVVFMSRNFDVITETVCTEEDLKLSKHVSVGWGKKETQFQGRGAKARQLRDPTIPEKVDEGKRSEKDDGRCSISWRGDGAYVAVNFLMEGVRRVVRVYTREGELDSVSEPVDGLEGSLSWRPEGNLIAGIQRLPGQVDVVFFERNGLRHGQFTLRAPQDGLGAMDNIALEWNADSTVLAVILRDRVQLWTMGNYHYYLKQEVLCGDPRSGNLRPLFAWHAEKALLWAASTPGKVLINEYAFAIARGPTSAPHDQGAVAVIDGRTIKFTPFRTANVPPPMAFCEVEVETPAIDVAFSTDCSKMAVLHRGGVSLFAFEANGPRLPAPKLVCTVMFEKSTEQQYEEPLLQIGFSRPTEVAVLQMADDLELLSHDFSAVEGKPWRKTDASSIGTITTPSSGEIDGVVAQHVSGRLSCIAGGEHSFVSVEFPTFLPWANYIVLNGEVVAFGLSRNGHLYANTRQLAKNCTSFAVTEDHLIFTTSNHYVKFVHLTAVDALDVPPDDPEKDERCRSIERGGRLVTAIPTRMSLVLQMPRGNLETIYPRAMVLAGIRQRIEQKNYASAFATCRTQRVDMNILFDHRPEQFFENVGLFLEQVKDPANIDLFLSSLKDEDVTQTIYRDTKSGTPQTDVKTAQRPGKINTICDAVLKALKTQKKSNLQNIITAHVCKHPPALDDGLLVVAELMREDEELAERAVEHICFLADVNRLYDHALGLYNLELTLLVAQQSQMDPREYLPFIQNLHKMPELKRKFTIDDKLERYERALDHLKALNNFEDVKKYVVKHKLYHHALTIYRHDEPHHRAITGLFAAYLKSQSQFKEAGLAYESLGNFVDATECYLKAGVSCWRECLFAAQQQDPPISQEKLAEIATSLADALREAKDYSAAATIHLDYLTSLDTAIPLLCKGYHFADALRLITLHNRRDLLASAIDPGLADAFSSSTEFLADCRSQLRAQVPRILELRRKAKEDPLSFYEGDLSKAGADIPDDISVAASRVSTSASLFTRYTGKGAPGTVAGSQASSRATSRNRRREEKKRARGRKGTIYEEEYLVNSVRRLVERVEQSKPEIERLVWALVRRGMQEQARAMEEGLAQLLAGCEKAVGEVWPVKEGQGQTQEQRDGEQEMMGWRPGGAEGVLYDSMEALRKDQRPPSVGGVKRLVLLGKEGKV